MLNVFVTNLGKYNEGELIGKWLNLPASDAEIKNTFETIGISDTPDENGNYYEEYFITDYESDIDEIKVGEYDSIERLNEIAESIENLNDYEEIAFEAFLEHGYSFDYAIEKVNDGDYRIYWDCSNMTDVAYQVVDECGYLDNAPSFLSTYFDYEAFGRDLDIEGTFIFIGSDCVEILK